MSFRLFGIPVEVQVGFWITAFLLGIPVLQSPGLPKTALLVWVLVMLVSVLIHELGHALMIRRHKVDPEIALHWMGGTTTWQLTLPLRRIDRVLISLAGPFAGFFMAGAVIGLRYAAPGLFASLPVLVDFGVDTFVRINIFWGIINLIPVLPFDGGHVLEHALGPKRLKLTYGISLFIGTAVALFFLLVFESVWGFFIFGLGAFQSYQRMRAEGPARAETPQTMVRQSRAQEPLPPELAARLRQAKQALTDEDLDRAIQLAQQILDGAVPADPAPASHGDEAPLSGTPITGGPPPPVPRGDPAPPAAAHAALEVIGWAHLLAGRVDDAAQAAETARRIGPTDPALVGGIAHARRDLGEARRVLEAARASGDDRKEVVGPLIQILIEQGEVARAGAVAYDIVDSLSEDDARRMGEIAFDGRAYAWSARLYEAVFQRLRQPEDAYAAARALAKDDQADRAFELLRHAVDAGFSDRARAWSDAALEALRGDQRLSAVLPRP